MFKLTVWTGPVHSGKTKKALTVARRLVGLGHDVVAVRPEAARREHEEEGWITTKDGESWPCFDLVYPEMMLEAADGCTTFWLDEPMLFAPEEEQVFGILTKIRQHADVMVTGLVATDGLEVFGESMHRLVAVADHVYWCKADCRECGKLDAATRSFYIGEGQKEEQVKRGGEETYAALCPPCWRGLTASGRAPHPRKGEAPAPTPQAAAAQIET